MEQEEEDQRKSKRIFLKPKKTNGFDKSKRIKQKPKKADNDTDNEEDKEKEEDNDLLSNKNVEEIQKIIIETLGNTNLTVIQEAIGYLDEFPLEVIKEALIRTARKQKKWDYARGTLNNWSRNGLDTLEKIEANDIDFKTKSNISEESDEEKMQRKLKALEEGLQSDTR